MNIIYKKALPAHIPQIYEIEKLCFPDPWSVSSFIKEFEDEKARYFIAEVQNSIQNTGEHSIADSAAETQTGAVAGYCGYWSIVGEAHITNIAVHPDNRGRGVGAGLIGAMLDDIAELGHTAATLEVREDNYVAIRLYERFGFEQYGRRKKYYTREKKDALIMWKKFGQSAIIYKP